MGEHAPPFGPRDAVVVDRPSRHPGLRVTAVAFADGTPRIRGYLHTPEWDRVAAMGTGRSAGEAAVRAEDLFERALRRGVGVQPATLRPVERERGAA
jgi:hypothetical protein